MDEIFSFDKFLNGKSKPKLGVSDNEELQKEELQATSEITDNTIEDTIEDETPNNIDETESQLTEDSNSNEGFYPLFVDKGENFTCDIKIEGADQEETTARIIVETEDWSLLFPGQISNGKCTVPIRKLNIFKEGQIGKIRLEVIAEGTVLIPWEDSFKAKMSKKVVVSVNEKNNIPKPTQKGASVKVNVNR